MTRKSFKMVVTVVLALVMGFAPVGSVLAAEADDIAVTDTDAYTYADDAAESEETVVEHYWDRYGWDETSHLLICNCGVSNCSLAGTDSRGVHNFGDWYTVEEPTETEAGLKTRSCWCGYRQYEAIPALAAEEKPEEKPDDNTTDEGKTDNNTDSETDDNKVTDNKTEDKADNNKVEDNKTTEDNGVTDQGTNGSESNNNGGSSTKDDSTAATTPTAPATTTPPAPVVIPVPTTVPTQPTTVTPVVNVTTVTNVTVQPSRVNRITINKSKTVKVGKKVKLAAKYTGFSRKNFSWKISNKKRATVTKDGVVKAKKAGRGKTVTVTATAKKYGTNTTTIVKIVYKIKIK